MVDSIIAFLVSIVISFMLMLSLVQGSESLTDEWMVGLAGLGVVVTIWAEPSGPNLSFLSQAISCLAQASAVSRSRFSRSVPVHRLVMGIGLKMESGHLGLYQPVVRHKPL